MKISSVKNLGQLDSTSQNVDYNELNATIETVCRVIYITLTQLTIPGIFLPFFLITVVNYFVYDLGDKSYYVPCSMLYVSN